jgi:hypothetical protein
MDETKPISRIIAKGHLVKFVYREVMTLSAVGTREVVWKTY